jgi:hypothetical protein
MGLKSTFVKPFASFIAKTVRKKTKTAVKDQQKLMKELVAKAKDTKYGRDHNFSKIKTYDDFKRFVPIADYEDLRSYIDRITHGESDILWPGLPKYLAKTSGTTSGIKYIPITKDSMPNHIQSTMMAMMNYIDQTKDASIFDGKMIFLSGSPELDIKAGIATGRLSGIVNHEIPAWIRGNQLPSYETNCIEEWEEKLERVIDETINEDMRLISGIPPWVQMYYERLLARTGKDKVIDVFPNLSLFIYGGVNFEPYRSKLEELVGKKINSIELYPASEGFIAFQDDQKSKALLLNTRGGIFYEFIPNNEVFDENPTRIMLNDVQKDIDYAIIINNNAGLWGYNIGDLVRFVSLNPYKIIITGRIKHFISAFGEHVIGKEVEEAMLEVTTQFGVNIIEFTVAPQVNPKDGLPYHEWFVEFAEKPENLNQFAMELDRSMVKKNIYYEDLISGGILRPLVLTVLRKDAFRNFMKDQGKLGGQNKVPRLSNDRKIADELEKFIQK